MDLVAALRAIEERTSSTIGVTDLSPLPEVEATIRERVDAGLHGGLSFTYADPTTASRPADSFPWASSIVVVAVPYLREGDGTQDGRTVARFADGDRYVGLRDVLGEIAEVLEADGRRTEIVYDDNRLVDRALAVRAGIAWSGKSTMVLTPGVGPWILLGSVVTDASLEISPPMRRTCGTCDACLPACPTGAIIAPGVLDARLCISAVLQRRGAIDPILREAIGGRIYGCDECLTVCPPGEPALRKTSATTDVLSPSSVLLADDRELEEAVMHWYVPSRKMRFVRRNALVALGNTGDETALGLLAGYLGHDDSLLAEHAAWAIGNIGGTAGAAICGAALTSETRESVREELISAVAACTR
jgi:epoxyqueuosine reductase